jgi:hypothetical protein
MPRKTKTLSSSKAVETSPAKSGPAYWLFKTER